MQPIENSFSFYSSIIGLSPVLYLSQDEVVRDASAPEDANEVGHSHKDIVVDLQHVAE